jgi:hypothetical protein
VDTEPPMTIKRRMSDGKFGFTDRNLNATLGIKPVKNQELELKHSIIRHLMLASRRCSFRTKSSSNLQRGNPPTDIRKINFPQTFTRIGRSEYQRLSSKYRPDVEMIPNTPPSTVGNTRMTACKCYPEVRIIQLVQCWIPAGKPVRITFWLPELTSGSEKCDNQRKIYPSGNSGSLPNSDSNKRNCTG